MASVSLQRVTRTFPGMDHPAVDRVDLDVADGELVVLLGGAGCGKSTILRLIAGVETPDIGHLLIDGVDVTREPIDRLQQIIAQSWYWIGGFCAPSDTTTTPSTVSTATNAAFKRAVMIEHFG